MDCLPFVCVRLICLLFLFLSFPYRCETQQAKNRSFPRMPIDFGASFLFVLKALLKILKEKDMPNPPTQK